jgi:hypothetical protein
MTTLVAPDVDLKKAEEAKDWSCANSYMYAVMVAHLLRFHFVFRGYEFIL